MMILKVCIQIHMNIPSVNAELLDPKNESSLWIQMIFGRIHKLHKPGEPLDKNDADPNATLFQFLAFFIAIYCTQAWKTTKWLEIRDKTPELKFSPSSLIRFWKYIQVRQQEDQEETINMNIFNSKDKKKIKELEDKLKEQKKLKDKGLTGRYDSGNAIKKAKKANNYLSQLVLFVA